MSSNVQCVVVGAGVVGLAIARRLARAGREVLVLEQEKHIGMWTSSRNSEVIHAGLYYLQNSLKAKLCVEGRKMLYEYCKEYGVSHRQCGKLIVATDQSELSDLFLIKQKAELNNVFDLQFLTSRDAQELEPEVTCKGALLSPSTGIIDSHSLMQSLQADAELHGATFVMQTKLDQGKILPNGDIEIICGGYPIQAKLFINSAGLFASEVMKSIEGFPSQFIPNMYYAKGSYFQLKGRSPFSRLVYPIPHLAGLGVHATIDISGRTKFGPDVEWVDNPFDYLVNPNRCLDFYGEVRKYYPNLPDDSLEPDYSGIRPKIQEPGGKAKDFLISDETVHKIKSVISLFGIESPGLTSSLAIAEYVFAAAEKQL